LPHQYQSLNPAGLAELRRQRVHELECEHGRNSLLLEELPAESSAAAGLLAQLAELERRIALHLHVLAGDGSPVTPGGAAGGTDHGGD
jgi:hypothetical protein